MAIAHSWETMLIEGFTVFPKLLCEIERLSFFAFQLYDYPDMLIV